MLGYLRALAGEKEANLSLLSEWRLRKVNTLRVVDPNLSCFLQCLASLSQLLSKVTQRSRNQRQLVSGFLAGQLAGREREIA
jgi:hypothetical protein